MNIKYYVKNIIKNRGHIALYNPRHFRKPEQLLELTNKRSAWQGLELIIEDILTRFKIQRNSCIEFGVEFGYSTVVFSNFFKKVVGVDTFEGDIHAGQTNNHFEQTKKKLSSYKNIDLVMSDYRDWIIKDHNKYDFAHVDIIHTYEDTYKCGLWAAKHCRCVIFHDTETFPEVRKAVIDIAKHTGKKLYNYPYYNGLGILVNVPQKIK